MDVIPSTLMHLVPHAEESFICSDLSRQQVALIQLRSSLLKKLQPRGKNKAADKAALDLFLESNEACSHWEPDVTSYHYDTMNRAREKFRARFFGGELQSPFWSLNRAINHGKTGPGSSRGTKHTDFVGKMFNSTLTTYDASLWEYYRSSIPTLWKAAELVREKQYGRPEVVKASRMTFAKKNHDVSRVINTEASLEMYFQLGLGYCMEDFLKVYFNIDLSKQPDINSNLARLGSIDGSIATIDLKSASDLDSYSFVSWFMPSQAVKPLDSVRAKCIELPDGTVVDLHMFSTMGNGFTFPLITILFASIVEAAYEELGLPTWNFSSMPAFSVFGDDIICVRQAYDKVCSLLEWCGFTVNRHKSFNSGSFRESCGSDFYKGHDVRGIYVKKLYHETHYYSIFNSLTRWSIRNGVDITALLRYIFSLVVFRPVPFDAADSAGIKCTCTQSNADTRAEGRTYFKRYVPVPDRRSTRKYESNPIALEIAAVGGYINGSNSSVVSAERRYDSLWKPNLGPVGSFTMRAKPDGEPRVKLRQAYTTSWDWLPQRDLTTLDYEITLGSVFVS